MHSNMSVISKKKAYNAARKPQIIFEETPKQTQKKTKTKEAPRSVINNAFSALYESGNTSSSESEHEEDSFPSFGESELVRTKSIGAWGRKSQKIKEDVEKPVAKKRKIEEPKEAFPSLGSNSLRETKSTPKTAWGEKSQFVMSNVKKIVPEQMKKEEEPEPIEIKPGNFPKVSWADEAWDDSDSDYDDEDYDSDN